MPASCSKQRKRMSVRLPLPVDTPTRNTSVAVSRHPQERVRRNTDADFWSSGIWGIVFIIGSQHTIFRQKPKKHPLTSKTLVPRVWRCIAVFPYENKFSPEIRQYIANAYGIFTHQRAINIKNIQPVRLGIVVGAVSHRTMRNGILYFPSINSNSILATVR